MPFGTVAKWLLCISNIHLLGRFSLAFLYMDIQTNEHVFSIIGIDCVVFHIHIKSAFSSSIQDTKYVEFMRTLFSPHMFLYSFSFFHTYFHFHQSPPQQTNIICIMIPWHFGISFIIELMNVVSTVNQWIESIHISGSMVAHVPKTPILNEFVR